MCVCVYKYYVCVRLIRLADKRSCRAGVCTGLVVQPDHRRAVSATPHLLKPHLLDACSMATTSSCACQRLMTRHSLAPTTGGAAADAAVWVHGRGAAAPARHLRHQPPQPGAHRAALGGAWRRRHGVPGGCAWDWRGRWEWDWDCDG
eukprot:XP_001695774.1 predicted protein [Chlamydomonas reinhardtii]